MTTLELMKKAKAAAPSFARASTEIKNDALAYMAEMILNDSEAILSANEKDGTEARGNISDVMIDRLSLTEQRLETMAEGIRTVIALDNPVGKILERIERPNGLVIEKTTVPLGVIAIIYESRPNVTADAAALALKSGNSCILRVGKEAWRSANAITCALKKGIQKAGLPQDGIQLVEDVSRRSAIDLMEGVGYIDLLIPRGGAGLIRACTENAKVPCIQTGTGICHIYVDDSADLDMAADIVVNAKTSRPSVCNAAEVLIVNSRIAPKFLPMLKKRICGEGAAHSVELRLDQSASQIITGGVMATASDFDTEFLDYILAVKTVNSVDEAIAHIAAHSTGHSEAILTNTKENENKFLQEVDSAAVYVNASTRFTDGGEFGLGCEMGISTQKLHARGPMGLQELTTYKYIVRGTGQIR